MNIIKNLKNLQFFCGKKDAFDCAGIRAQVFRLPVDCSNFHVFSKKMFCIILWKFSRFYYFHNTKVVLKNILRNFKNSKPLESPKNKKHDQIWTKIATPQLNNHEKTNKKGGKKKKGNLPKPLPSSPFFRPLLSL